MAAIALVTLRPNGTVQQVGVITTGAVAPHTVLSDNSDATRAQGSLDRGFLHLDLGTTTLSALRVKEAQLRVRDAHDTVGAGNQTGWARFRDPVDGTVTGMLPMSRGQTNVDYQYGEKVNSAPGGKAWTQTVLSRMQVEMAWVEAPDGNFLGVQELYADVWTNTQPTVSGVTVTGAASTTRPTIAWTYADTEGDVQSRYRVFVYSAAQYGAAGFVAGSSTATWDSGDRFGNGYTLDLTSDLQNGTTYKAYVKAAHDWPGPEGELWWSALAVSSTFTIAVVPPPQPSITVTPETSLPAYRQRITVTAPVNVLTADEANLEAGIGGWSSESNCTVAQSATNPAQGSQCLAVTATAAADAIARAGTFSTSHRVKPGTSVTSLVSFRAATTGRTCNAGIKWYDAAGGVISLQYGSNVTDTTGGYTQASATFTAPSNAYSAHPLAKVVAPGAGEVHRIDKISLAPGTSTAWTDGGYLQNGSVLIERSQRISPAIGRGPARNWLHPQIHSSGALLGNADGFTARNAVDSVTARILDRAPLEAPGNVTAGMIQWAIRTGTSSYLDIGAPDGVATDGQQPYVFPAVPGKDMTLSMWLWASAAITIRLGLYFTDAFNGGLTLPFSGTVVLSTTPQKVTVGGTPGATAVYARGVVENNSSTNNVSVFLSQPRFRPTSDPDESWPGQTWAFEWETVRGVPALPQDGEDLVAYDHEAPPGRPVLYRATVVGQNSTGQSMAGPPSVPVHVYTDPPARNLIKSPYQPENAAVVNIARYSESQGQDAQVFHPLGRDGDPVLVRDWIGGQDGSYELATLSLQEWYRLRQLIGSARPLLLQFAEGGQHYVLLDGDRSSERVGYGTTKTTVKVLQCARPA